jgi:hypothetical protein
VEISQGIADMVQKADTAAVTTPVPFCVATAQQPPEQRALAKVKAEDYAFSRSELVMRAGWVTVGPNKTPDNALAIDRLRQFTAYGEATRMKRRPNGLMPWSLESQRTPHGARTMEQTRGSTWTRNEMHLRELRRALL